LDRDLISNQRRYINKKFTFGKKTIELLDLDPGVDWDVTGQVVWTGAEILSQYFAEQIEQGTDPFFAPDNLQQLSILELGSGPGLCGLYMAQYCRKTVLSDCDEIVLDLLQKNAKINEHGKYHHIQDNACNHLYTN
jgi:tRNA G26 N,N-dimethylase Trm1